MLVGVSVIRLDTAHVYGEIFVLLSCSGHCSSSKCPLKPLKHDSCPNVPNKVFTLAENTFLTFAVKQNEKDRFHNHFFQCVNEKCISFNQVCDLADDCGDGSDEASCINHFRCTETKFYIPLVKKCDKVVDCPDKSDECNDDCGKQILSGMPLKVSAWAIGVCAVLFNSVSLCRGIKTIKGKKDAALANRVFSILINLGDLLVGLYLLIISSYDFSFSEDYCEKQFQWLSSDSCAYLGIINTVGSTLSLFSMAILSIFRAISIKGMQTDQMRFRRRTPWIVAGLTFFISILIAFSPILDSLEDLMVNGMTYKEISLFIGSGSKIDHIKVLRAYFGKIKSPSLTWNTIQNLLYLMFSQDYGRIKSSKVHFYGNDGVCLFKFFVKSDDPQKLFVWTIIVVNSTCVTVISVCYCFINITASKSSKALRKMMGRNGVDNAINEQARRLQRNITRIIITDFLCWIPFLVTCLLHSLEVIDATFLYSVFSIVILPINSCLNPLIYDNFIRERFWRPINFMKKRVQRKVPDLEMVPMPK